MRFFQWWCFCDQMGLSKKFIWIIPEHCRCQMKTFLILWPIDRTHFLGRAEHYHNSKNRMCWSLRTTARMGRVAWWFCSIYLCSTWTVKPKNKHQIFLFKLICDVFGFEYEAKNAPIPGYQLRRFLLVSCAKYPFGQTLAHVLAVPTNLLSWHALEMWRISGVEFHAHMQEH